MKTFFVLIFLCMSGFGIQAAEHLLLRACPFQVNPLTTQTCADAAVAGELAPQVSGGVAPYTFAQQGTAVGGSVIITANTGHFVFTPTTGFRGTATFQFIVTDSIACVSGPATVTINVLCCLNSSDPFVNYFDSIYFDAIGLPG